MRVTKRPRNVDPLGWLSADLDLTTNNGRSHPGLRRYTANGTNRRQNNEMKVDSRPNAEGTYALEALMMLDGAHEATSGVMADPSNGFQAKQRLWNGTDAKDAAIDGFFMSFENFDSDAAQQADLDQRDASTRLAYEHAIYHTDVRFEIEAVTKNPKRRPTNPVVKTPTHHGDADSDLRDAASGLDHDWELEGNPTEQFEFKSVWKRAYEKFPKILRIAVDEKGLSYNRMDPELTDEMLRSTIVERLDPKTRKMTKSFAHFPETVLAAALCDLASSQEVPSSDPASVNDEAMAAMALNKKHDSAKRAQFFTRFPRAVPNTRGRSLRDYVEGQCVSWRKHAGDRALSALGDNDGVHRVDRFGGIPSSRSAQAKAQSKNESALGDFEALAANGQVRGFPETLIYLGDEFGEEFASELYTWTHFAALDTSGPKPRGSLLVRYVDWRDSYEKYPSLPVFRPDTCSDLDKWERYTRRLRRAKLLSDTDLYKNATGFDLDAFMEKMKAEGGWECCLPSSRTDGQAGSSDYLYVILVCSNPKGGYGKVQVDAAKTLSKTFGTRRLVLSALGDVLPFYFGLNFMPVSRSGRSLRYVLDRPLNDTFTVPKGKSSTTVDIYNARLLRPEDFLDPLLREGPNPPLPFYALHDAAVYDVANSSHSQRFDPEHNWGPDQVSFERTPKQLEPVPWPYATPPPPPTETTTKRRGRSARAPVSGSATLPMAAPQGAAAEFPA